MIFLFVFVLDIVKDYGPLRDLLHPIWKVQKDLKYGRRFRRKKKDASKKCNCKGTMGQP